MSINTILAADAADQTATLQLRHQLRQRRSCSRSSRKHCDPIDERCMQMKNDANSHISISLRGQVPQTSPFARAKDKKKKIEKKKTGARQHSVALLQINKPQLT